MMCARRYGRVSSAMDDRAGRPLAGAWIETRARGKGVRLGLSVPGDVALVSYNDIPVVSRLPTSLTSVRAPVDQIAASAPGLLRELQDPGAGRIRVGGLPPFRVGQPFPGRLSGSAAMPVALRREPGDKEISGTCRVIAGQTRGALPSPGGI